MFYSRKPSNPYNTDNRKIKSTSRRNKSLTVSSDTENAKQLRSILVDLLRIKGAWSCSGWADQFRLLRGDLGHEDHRIKPILDWYAASCGKPGIPRILSARHFRQSFSRLEELAEKNKIVEVNLCAQGKAVLSRLQCLNWPKDSGTQLPAAVQLCITNTRALRQALLAIKPDDSIEKNWLVHLNRTMGSTFSFAERWLGMVHMSIKNWHTWNGNLLDLCVDLNSKEMYRVGCGISVSYSGSTKLWEKTLKRINSESHKQ